MRRREGVTCKPMLARLSFEVLQKQLDFSCTVLFGERDENVWTTETAVILQNFVRQNQVIPNAFPEGFCTCIRPAPRLQTAVNLLD